MISSSLTASTNKNWMYPSIRQISCLLQSIQGIYAPLEPFFYILWLQLTPGITSFKILCQARVLFLPVPKARKMSASKLICYFSSHLATFGLWASLPPDNITVSLPIWIPINLSDFQSSTVATVHATFRHRAAHFSYQSSTVDTIASLQSYDGGITGASEMHESQIFINKYLQNWYKRILSNK